MGSNATRKRQGEREFQDHMDALGWWIIGDYVNKNVPVKVECNKGHEFELRPAYVPGTCRQCHPTRAARKKFDF